MTTRSVGYLYHKEWSRLANVGLGIFHRSLLHREWYDISTQLARDEARFSSYLPVDDSISWLEQILAWNGIDAAHFVRTCWIVFDRRAEKRNLLVYFGPANSGKTLIAVSQARSLCGWANIQNFSDRSTFFLQDIKDKRVVVINEPRIDDSKIETFKNLADGTPFQIDVKWEKGVRVNRVPGVITTNLPIHAYLLHAKQQIEPLKARITQFDFKTFPELKNCLGQLNPGMWPRLIEKYVLMLERTPSPEVELPPAEQADLLADESPRVLYSNPETGTVVECLTEDQVALLRLERGREAEVAPQ